MPEIRLVHLSGPVEDHWEGLGTLPFWGLAWPGGQVLARYVLDSPATVRGLRVLDLACGGGVVAVAAALAGAAAVTATDIDPLARAATRIAARTNAVDVQVSADDLLADGVPAGRFDVVLAGDVCYDPHLSALALATLRRAAAAGALVLLGDPGRAHLDKTGLRRLATFAVPTPEGAERDPVTTASVYQVPNP